jgi:hypothetical protein
VAASNSSGGVISEVPGYARDLVASAQQIVTPDESADGRLATDAVVATMTIVVVQPAAERVVCSPFRLLTVGT